MKAPRKAVFLSYASQDAQAAHHLCKALRAAGIEVWFDQSELRGGDAWDQTIRQQIRDCTLFLPIISQSTQVRTEGYFRLEWRLADQRTHLMGRNRAFLVPICVDATAERDADVPDSFTSVQWTRLPEGEASQDFLARVEILLYEQSPRGIAAQPPEVGRVVADASSARRLRIGVAIAVVIAVAAAASYFSVVSSRKVAPVSRVPAIEPVRATSPPIPEKSIAVLPFVDMSERKDQEYFADGLSEELIDMLANVQDLKVPARTSSFYFKGKQTTIAEIANALGVSHVLEGSVRKSGNHLRITAQLIKAGNGFHLWSHTYDAALTDTFKVQTEVATSVAQQLILAISSDVRGRMAAGGTLNPAAYDAYLQGSELYRRADPEESQYRAAFAELDRAVALDPKFALAHAKRARLVSSASVFGIPLANMSTPGEHARQEAALAVALAPEVAETHLAMADVLAYGHLDFAGAAPEFERAMALSPGNGEVLAGVAGFEEALGHYDAAIRAGRSATLLDPLNFNTHTGLGQIFIAAGRYEEALASLGAAQALAPKSSFVRANIGEAFLASGANEKAIDVCMPPALPKVESELCLAIAYHRLGRTAEAEQQFKQVKALAGDSGSVMMAGVYAQWGDRAAALASLAKAERLKDPQLQVLKQYWALAPIRSEPEFKAIEARMRFPP